MLKNKTVFEGLVKTLSVRLKSKKDLNNAIQLATNYLYKKKHMSTQQVRMTNDDKRQKLG